MTPRRLRGPQCAFEENKKERERAEWGSERRESSREKEPPGAASPDLAGTAGPPGATFCEEGRPPAAAASWASECGVGRAMTSASVDCILIKDSQQLFGIFTVSTTC